MEVLWSDDTKYRIHFEIEAHAADAMAELGIIPKAAAATIWEKGRDAKIDVGRILEIEKETRHETIAFTTHLAEIIGPEARFVHQGMTSSDVLDTTLAVQLARATDILIADVDLLLAALKRRAFEHKYTITIARSHGIHGEPTTFGLKLAGFYAEFTRARARLIAARAEIATCMISGAMGTFANVDPQVEAHVAAKLGLTVEPMSTQVIPRDRHAAYFAALGVVASSLERLATEVRHLQRTEVLEAQEFFAEGQKGSSAMPHKRNPILSENIVGLARMVRAYVMPALENVALWHERDMSHSSVERFIAPDATITLDFALVRAAGVIDKLLVRADRMKKNLDSTQGIIHSQRALLALTQAGIEREAAYKLVQGNAMRAWAGEGTLLELLKADPNVASAVPAKALEAMFDLEYHTSQVDTIFKRVFG
jgi:adenylosuccinate lyase